MGSVRRGVPTGRRRAADQGRALAAAASRWVAEASYVRKWVVLGVAIGVIAGLGAVVFFGALQLATHLFMRDLVGYRIPTPFGEGNLGPHQGPARAWALPLVAGGGALLGAILVFRIAPEAEGHGTDAAISAVHHNPRGVRFRTVLVKIVASALTIGSGGSGGREGPTGQISAGFGSLLARVLDLGPEDARIAVAAGIGSGIGAIFGAPLGGAVLAAEILYRDDVDPAALLPSFIASGVGYAIFGAVEGYGPLFGVHAATTVFTAPGHLVWFALIGLLGGLIGLAYCSGFYGLNAAFVRSRLPKWLAPALGAVAVGLIALEIPQVLGTGYGWIQQGLGSSLRAIPLWIVLVLPFARIVATGLSIGSGGSGGIFGPGMVIGAFVGAAVWRLLDPVFPSMGPPAPYVIVGMMCCFGSVSRAPLAVMLMVAEMTGSIASLEPGLIAVGIAWLIVRQRDATMYQSQLARRDAAPDRALLSQLAVLPTIPARTWASQSRPVLAAGVSAGEAAGVLRMSEHTAAPVADESGRFAGTVTLAALEAADPDASWGGLPDSSAAVVDQDSALDVALDALTSSRSPFVTVLDRDRRIVGTISGTEFINAYHDRMRSPGPADANSVPNGGPGPGAPVESAA